MNAQPPTHGTRRPSAWRGAAFALAMATTCALAQTDPTLSAPATAAVAPAAAAPGAGEGELKGAERLGSGRLTAWRAGNRTLVALPVDALGKPVAWYTEVVGVPAGLVLGGGQDGLEVNNTLARFERVGNTVYLRDLGITIKRRAAPPRDDHGPTEIPGANAVKLSTSLMCMV